MDILCNPVPGNIQQALQALLLVEEQMFWLDCSHLASQKLEEHPPSTMNRQITDGV